MENARQLLKGVEERNSQMLTIIHQYTNYVLLILGGIWAFFINSFQNSIIKLSNDNIPINYSQMSLSNFVLHFALTDLSILILVAIGISLISLFIWRLYIHILDNDIARNYRKIILLQKRLYGNTEEIPEFSTLFSLVDDVPELKKILQDNGKKSYSQQSFIIFKLIEKGLIGSRGHWIIDLLFFFIVFIFVAIIDVIFFLNSTFSSSIFNLLLTIFINIALICSAFLILFNPYNVIPFIQKEAKPIHILRIIRNEDPFDLKLTNQIIKIGLILAAFVIIGTILYASFGFGYNSGKVQTQKEDGQNLEEFFNNKYHAEYNIQGSEFIDSVSEKAKHSGNDLEKLNIIADSITNNFSDPFWRDNLEADGLNHWQKNFYSNLSGNEYKQFINKSSVMPQFWFDKRGRVRVDYITENSFYRSPEWIASQQTGACQELSVLFNATANRAGIETRIIRSDGAYYPGGHLWNEVNISGEWQFFDVQQYGLNQNTNNSTQWFGNTSEYASIILPDAECDLTRYGVYILDNSHEGYAEPPITDSYDPKHHCPHGTRKK